MNHERLLEELGLNETARGEAGVGVQFVEEGKPEQRQAKSDTALVLDSYCRAKGAELLEGDFLPKALPRTAEIQGQRVEIIDEQQQQLAAADMYASAFELSPELEKSCADETRHKFMRELMDTSDYSSLHLATQLDPMASEMAAAAFAKQYATLLREHAERDARGEQAATGDGFADDMRHIRAAGEACREAQEDVQSLNDMRDSMGLGGDGGGNGSIDVSQMKSAFQRVRNSSQLREIVNRAGRYRRFMQAAQRRKTKHGRDEIIGVELGGDIERLVASELTRLAVPELQVDSIRRLVERQAMVYDCHGIERQAQGPICVIVDESASMGGEKIFCAKAIALAMYWLARQQRRWCCLIGFSGGTEGNILTIPSGKSDPSGLMGWLEHFFGGGTDMDVPCDVLPQQWGAIGAPKGKTDILIITDAIINLPSDMEKRFNTWRAAEQAKVTSLVIQGRSRIGDIAKISDSVHRVEDLGLNEAGVQEALSI